ncbi:MAG: hypothetical protein JWO48_2976, partial [Bryobacterales bacterium]|nr:hypothetical protein [Bryobacterales bacterium]
KHADFPSNEANRMLTYGGSDARCPSDFASGFNGGRGVPRPYGIDFYTPFTPSSIR